MPDSFKNRGISLVKTGEKFAETAMRNGLLFEFLAELDGLINNKLKKVIIGKVKAVSNLFTLPLLRFICI